MNSDNFNTQVCRICLQSHTKLMLIFDSNAVQMLHECNFCEVSKDDGLPNQICATCFTTLEECYTFKKLCKKSDTILKEQLINRTSKNWQEEINLFVNKIREDTINQDSSLNGLKYDITESNVNKEEEHIQNLSDSEKYSSKENLISFLEKPLPPPLPFQCQHCTQSFNEENDLQIHQSVHNSDLMCVTCSKKFAGRQSLKRHLKIHLIQKPHTCKICNKSFPESYDLVKHLRRHSGIPRDKRHFCEVCGQGFSEPYYLKIHVRKHTGERPFECQNCHKRFADPRSFKTHSMIHAGSKPFKCNFCLKNFIQSANLTKHMRIHTGEKPYVCKICDKKFSQSSSLERHFRSHTGKNNTVMTKH